MAAVRSYVDVFLSPSMQNYISNNTMVGVWWNKASAAFWTADFWLPAGIRWEDLVDTEEMRYPNFHDMCVYPLFLGVMLLLVKSFIIEPFILDPLARLAGVPNNRPRPPVPSKVMEALYLRHGHVPPHEALKEASDTTDMTTRQAERWLRRRRAFAQTTLYEKFIDCGFNLLCHASLTVFGVMVMWSKPWLWDISEALNNYPHHHIDDDIWWYYVVGLSYFWASTFLQVHSPGRSTFDKMQMMLHHLFTVLLMMFSWSCNFTRSGSLVLFLHEFADLPLLLAKMLTYAGFKAATDASFVVFLLSWAMTRCYLYPFWFMKEVFIGTDDSVHTPAYNLLYGLLCGLLVINMVWTFLICRVIMKKVTAGSLQDVRSDGEGLTTDDEDNETWKAKDKAE